MLCALLLLAVRARRRKKATAALVNYLSIFHKSLAVTECQTSGYDDLLPRYNDTTYCSNRRRSRNAILLYRHDGDGG